MDAVQPLRLESGSGVLRNVLNDGTYRFLTHQVIYFDCGIYIGSFTLF